MKSVRAAKPTLEQRIVKILSGLGEPITDANKLRALRCVEALVAIGSPAAIELLQMLAAGAEGAYETQQARAALRWMKP